MLERNEVISLFNLLERLAAGVEVVRTLSLQLRWGLPANQPPGASSVLRFVLSKARRTLLFGRSGAAGCSAPQAVLPHACRRLCPPPGSSLAALLFLLCSGNGNTHPGGLGAIQDVTKSKPLQQNLRES